MTLFFLKDVMVMQNDTAVIPYQSHLGTTEEYHAVLIMSYTCIYKYIQNDSL